MIKYFLFIVGLLVMGISSVHAGEDMDAICSDDSKQGLLYENPKVYYPNEEVSVENLLKKYYGKIRFEGPSDPDGYYVLYYVVNILGKNQTNDRSELYSYDCKTKKAKQLMNITINHSIESYYRVDNISKNELVLVGRYGGIFIGTTGTVIIYSLDTGRGLFTFKNTLNILPEGEITGFVSGKGFWYFYYAAPDFLRSPELYSINKKTKKVTKL